MFGRAAWAVLTIICAAIAFGAVQTEKAVELQEGEGKRILQTTCSVCHGLNEVVKNEGLAKEEWRKIVQQMIQEGAELKDDQANVLAGYLASNFGEGRKILDTACTVCHSLDEVTKIRGFFKRE